MKAFTLTVLLLMFAAACTTTSSIPATPTTALIGLTAIITPTKAIATSEPQVNPTSNGAVHIAFDPADWTFLYENKNAPVSIAKDSQGHMWAFVHDEISYFDGQNWISVSHDKFDLSNLSQLHISPNGTLWVLGKKAQDTLLARFREGKWVTFPLPAEIARANGMIMAIDALDEIWIGISLCDTDHCLYQFDGDSWKEYPLPVRNHSVLGGIRVISDTAGNLWVCGGWQDGIAHFLGNGWKIYAGKDLWPDRPALNGGGEGMQNILK